jgi:hypothetical protein
MNRKDSSYATPAPDALGEIDLADMDKVTGGCQNCAAGGAHQQQQQPGGGQKGAQILQAAAPMIQSLIGGAGAR